MGNIKCEFCLELESTPESRFHAAYAAQGVTTRAIAETPSFVAWPTFGQLFVGSLLVLPRRHVARLSSLLDPELDELSELVDRLAEATDSEHILRFEHGAEAHTGGACGIYHAHLHLVPTPCAVNADRFLSSPQRYGGLADAFAALGEVDEYLVVSDDGEEWVAQIIDETNRAQYPSQYMRRRLVDEFSLVTPWDWRAYRQPEEAVMRVLEAAAG